MKIVVTGATGLLGSNAVKYFASNGYEVIAVDRKDGEVPNGVKLIVGDITDLAFCDSVIAGSNAVIHLGAIPNPIEPRQFTVFQNNTVSTFAVFTAAAQAKCNIVVYASSISAYGTAYSDQWTSPIYAPVDEKHPLVYEESYALSKEVNELSALMWSRRCGTTFVGMRFPWTNTPEKTLELARRFQNEDTVAPDVRFPKGVVAKILWTYLDLRDAVAALESVVKSEFKGAGVFNFAAPDTMAMDSTKSLMEKFHPGTELRGDFSGHQAPLSSRLFIQTFGYSPKYLIERSAI
jgi:nucleoside-diphosphate-sugar epimerase